MDNGTIKSDTIDGYYKSSTGGVVKVENDCVYITNTPGEIFSLSKQNYGYSLGTWQLASPFDTCKLIWTHNANGAQIIWEKISPEDAVTLMIGQINKVAQETSKRATSKKANTTQTYRMDDKAEGEEIPMLKTFQTLSYVKFPFLSDPVLMANHLRTIEKLGRSVGIVDETGEVPAFLETAFVIKVLDSLTEGKVRQAAEELVRLHGESWPQVREGLLRRFHNRLVMQSSITSRLAKINFKDVQNFEEFLSEATAIVSLVEHVYARSDAERRPVIREIISRLPDELRLDVIRDLHNKTRGFSDWETVIPFDESNAFSDDCISNLIRMRAMAYLEEQSLNRLQRSATQITRSFQSDRHRKQIPEAKDEKPSFNRVNDQLKEAQQWSRKFKEVVILKGAVCSDTQRIEEVLQKLSNPEFRRILGNNGNGRPYYIIGFNDTHNNLAKVKGLIPMATVEHFEPELKSVAKNFQ